MIPSWINESFIETAIRVGDGDAHATVKTISVSPALAPGENYSSDMYRVKVCLHGMAEERSLIVKILSPGNQKLSVIFTREQLLFSKLLPKLNMVSSKLSNFEALFAKLLHCGDQPEKFIVLEDLSVDGFQNAPRHKGLDLNHCKLVVQCLARLHALSVAQHSEDPECFDDVKNNVYSTGPDEIVRIYVEESIKSFVRALETWPEHYSKYGKKLLNFSDVLYQKLRFDTSYKQDSFNVLNHGDLSSNNIMFKYNADQLIALRFVDFQLSVFSSPALDLVYFLYSSLPEETCLEHTDELIAEYHSSLVQYLDLIGCSKLRMSLEELQEEVNNYLFYGLYAALISLPVKLASSAIAQDIKDSLADAADGASLSNSMYNNKRYMEYILKLLPVFEQKGVFNTSEASS